MKQLTAGRRCCAEDLFTGRDLEKCRAELDAYLEPFAVAEPIQRCAGCGLRLGGLLGTFSWGMVHGEGQCSECGWPARMLHRPTVEGEEQFFQVILQYHPDVVEAQP